MTDYEKILSAISRCDDPKKLQTQMENARRLKDDNVFQAAFRKFISLVPDAQSGTVEHDFWQTVNAYEHVLKTERGRTIRLQRTRQKVGRVGEVQTLRDWALNKKATDGFRWLLDHKMPELTGEAIVLRHPERFEPEEREAARDRLVAAGIDPDTLPNPQQTFNAVFSPSRP